MATATLDKETTPNSQDKPRQRKPSQRANAQRSVRQESDRAVRRKASSRSTTANATARRQQTSRVQQDHSPQTPEQLHHNDGAHYWHPLLTFVYLSYFVSIALVVPFVLDLAIGIPFNRASVLFDVIIVFCGLGLAYLSWNTHRDLA